MLEFEDGGTQQVREAAASHGPNINDWLYACLGDKTLEDIGGNDNNMKLKAEIQAGLNSLFTAAGLPELITGVLLNEISVQ